MHFVKLCYSLSFVCHEMNIRLRRNVNIQVYVETATDFNIPIEAGSLYVPLARCHRHL